MKEEKQINTHEKEIKEGGGSLGYAIHQFL